ncbi:MAG: LuxR C-terminal-related transcriptional regulator [Gammaproteobacteria bacterium]
MGNTAIRVLLVGDCAFARTGIRRILDDDPGVAVLAEADSPDDAIRIARREKTDIMVMDVNPPAVSVLEGTRKFMRQCPDARVVVLASALDDILAGRLLQSGVAGYLTKHCSAAELLSAIRQVQQGERYLSEELARYLAMNRLADGGASPFMSLSHRELQVMLLVAQGKNAREISRWLCLSPKTVNTYRQRLLGKLGVRSEVELTHLAVRHGVIDIGRVQ